MTFWQAYPWVWWAIFAAVCMVVAGMVAWLLWPVWEQRRHLFGRWRDLEPWDDDWQREPETDVDADQLIAEWHDEQGVMPSEPQNRGALAHMNLPGPARMPASGAGEHHHLEPWHEALWWDDPDLTVWDARQAALRCWEILHIEFPRLRAELGCPA